jgi:hypothetical protein
MEYKIIQPISTKTDFDEDQKKMPEFGWVKS